MESFYINDEDFLLNKARGAGFLSAMRGSDLPPLSLSCFSSVKALSQYKPEELVEMGVDFIWVGYEGQRAGYDKMKGRGYRELFTGLQRHGISVLASMIIGFDYQTPEIIQQEFEELLSLRPSLSQFLIYGPAHGTPLHERMAREGRLDQRKMGNPKYLDGFSLVFKHPHIGAQEMSAIQRRLYQEEYRRLGPSIFRIAEDWITGHLNLRDHPAPRVRAKAIKYGRDAHRAMLLMPASANYLSIIQASRLAALRRHIERSTGEMTVQERILARAVPPMILLSELRRRYGRGQQPTFSRRRFRRDRTLVPQWSSWSPMRLTTEVQG